MDPFYSTLIIASVIGIALCIASSLHQTLKGRDMLDAWADSNGYQIVHRKLCTFFRGPFFGNSSKYQQVFYVAVEGADGSTRTGYVRCGSLCWGVYTDQVDVRWDDE